MKVAVLQLAILKEVLPLPLPVQGKPVRREAGKRPRIVGSYGTALEQPRKSRASRVQKWPASRLLDCADLTTCQHGQRRR